MKGYKVVLNDYTSQSGNFKYEVGKTYTHKGNLKICKSGFHFCKKLIDCFKYYDFNSKNHVFEIEALGKIIADGDKSATNKIKIIRELSWEDVLALVNLGNNNTGKGNSGNNNSGRYNSGNYNSGWFNSGNYNSGDNNSGRYNSGRYNSGDYNSGRYNSGDYNSGRYNSGNNNSGCFNTTTPKMRFFDKESTWSGEDWSNSSACKILLRMPQGLMWICESEMTVEEKKQYPTYKTTGGYLKEKTQQELGKERLSWLNNLSKEDKKEIQSLPNFDEEKFFKILGIKEE